MHRKGKTYRKVEGMLNNRSKLWWMKSHRQIRPWQNWRHALHFTERYEHATSETNRKELNRTGRLKSKLCSLFHWSNGVLAYLIHLQSHLNKTKLYILFFFFLNRIHHSKDKIKTFKNNTCPFIAHHWFTKIFWALCVSTNSSISL